MGIECCQTIEKETKTIFLYTLMFATSESINEIRIDDKNHIKNRITQAQQS